MKNNGLKRLFDGFTQNLGLKLLAMTVACALWFIVNNITDPVDEISFYNVPVEIINADSVINEGKIYEVLDGTDTVNVQVKGKTSVLNNITKDDIRATADLSEITFLNTVQIEVTSKRNSSELDFGTNIQNMKLAIEDIKRVQMIINTSTAGTPAEGYVVGNVSSSQNIVRLQGPESLIASVDHVEAVANIDGYSSDINTSVELKLYNANGIEIDSDSITMNISTINVAVTILATKEVALNFNIPDSPAEGYISDGEVISVPETVVIAGRKNVLENVTAININDSLLSLKDKKEDYTNIINIKKYLPNGTQFADSSFGGNVSVTVKVEPIVRKTFQVPAKNFAAGSKPEGFDVTIKEFDSENPHPYEITVSGTQADVGSVLAEDIIGVADMNSMLSELNITEWKEGTYQGKVTFNLPERLELDKEYTLTLVVTKPGEEEEE